MNEELVDQAWHILKEKEGKGMVTPAYLGWRLRITENQAEKILAYLENENKIKTCNHMWFPYTEMVYCTDTNKKLYEIKQLKCHFCQKTKSDRKI